MTTSIFSEAPDMASDVAFRAWGSAISTNLATVGLVQTADTGQINWTTVTRSGAGVDGYEIWRFSDALQATAPVFIKIGYGNGNLASVPAVYVQIGTGSDGSGGLTGVQTTGWEMTGYTNQGGTGLSRVCKMAYNGGSFAFLGFDDTVFGNPQMFFAISRTYTNAGAYDGVGIQFYRFAGSGNPALYTQALNFQTPAALTIDTKGNYSFIPGAQASTTVVGDPQVYAHFASLPQTKIVPGMVTVNATDVAVNTTFSVAVAGATARTYLKIPNTYHGQANVDISPAYLAMIWE